MKPNHDFIAQRPLAQHAGFDGQGCRAQEIDPAAAMALLAPRFARELPMVLGALAGETLPDAAALDPRDGVMHELLARSGGPCLHGLLGAADGGPSLLVSIDALGALQLVDLAFGGEGKTPDPVPEKLPLSAQILAARIESEIAALAARIVGVPAFSPVRRDTDIAALRPFTADRPLWQLGFEITFPGCDAWTLRLTLAADQTVLLCSSEDDDGPVRSRSAGQHLTDPASAPFGDLPLTLRATLVDMRVPLARIAALKPGDVLAVSVARQVPLSIGTATIAHGSVGELDDRVALQIINAFPMEEARS